MVATFLSGFWNSVTDTIIGGTTYTADFFKNIGLAVAGALGSVFISIIKFFYDVFMTLVYVVQAVGNIISVVLKPITFLFNVFTNSIPSTSSLSSATTTITAISSQSLAVFSSIFPTGMSVSVLWGAIYALFSVYLLFSLIKSFRKL